MFYCEIIGIPKRLGKMKQVYIIGAKGIGQYGGYETFVQKLIEYSNNIYFHVACKANGDGHMDIGKLADSEWMGESAFRYRGAECFLVKVPEIGAAQAIVYDCKSIRKSIEDITANKISNPVVYVLACRIGPFFGRYVKLIHRLGGKVLVNPDGRAGIIWTNQKQRCKYKVSAA